MTFDQKTLTLKVSKDYSSREAWRNSPYVYQMQLGTPTLPFHSYSIFFTLVVNQIPGEAELALNGNTTTINVTEPWPEFYANNFKDYNYTLSEPTEGQIEEMLARRNAGVK